LVPDFFSAKKLFSKTPLPELGSSLVLVLEPNPV
jgi:hypothetical protein